MTQFESDQRALAVEKIRSRFAKDASALADLDESLAALRAGTRAHYDRCESQGIELTRRLEVLEAVVIELRAEHFNLNARFELLVGAAATNLSADLLFSRLETLEARLALLEPAVS